MVISLSYFRPCNVASRSGLHVCDDFLFVRNSFAQREGEGVVFNDKLCWIFGKQDCVKQHRVDTTTPPPLRLLTSRAFAAEQLPSGCRSLRRILIICGNLFEVRLLPYVVLFTGKGDSKVFPGKFHFFLCYRMWNTIVKTIKLFRIIKI
jgi:hypothetical protein